MKRLLVTLIASFALGTGLLACGGDDDKTTEPATPAAQTSGTTDTTQAIDGNEMGDDDGGTEEADGNEMGDDDTGGVTPDTTEAEDGNQMGDDNN